jgi:hypothetical protein
MRRSLLLLSTLAASWLAMQLVHETGHVAGAWLSGGTIERVVLHPLELSRTDLRFNPHPLLVSWAGPVVGVALPLGFWALTWALRLTFRYLARFFAGFCLVANGVYVGAGAVTRIGDGGTMLAHGAPQWTLLLFALVTTPAGLFLWHREGRHFGLGPTPERVGLLASALTTTVFMVLLLYGVTLGKG